MLHHTSPDPGLSKTMSFKDYYLGTILRPRRTFEALPADERRLRFGLYALSLNALLYTLVYVFLAKGGGAPSSFTSFLAIPKDQWRSTRRPSGAPSS